MSNSDDEYGPPLPPGMVGKKGETDSSDDQYLPPFPKRTKRTQSGSIDVIGPMLPPMGINSNKYSSDSDSSSSDSSGSDSSTKFRKSCKSKKTEYSKNSDNVIKDNQNFIGPCVPTTHSVDKNISSRCIGPSLPPGQHVDGENQHLPADDSDDGIGPSIELQASEQDHSVVSEFEGRSQKMLNQLKKSTEPEQEKPAERESWMTELPDQIGVHFGLSNRQFRTRDASEMDSSWTETPKEQRDKSKDGKKKKKYEHAQADKNTKAAAEIEEYNRKHRPKSLLEMHQKKMEKKRKKEKKKNKDKKAERRPFDRDLDLQVNRLDEAQRKALIKRTQDLGSRFKTGGTGTSFM